jgi:hypothetical protein
MGLALMAFALLTGGCGGGGTSPDDPDDPDTPVNPVNPDNPVTPGDPVSPSNLEGNWRFDSGRPSSGSLTVVGTGAYDGTYSLQMADGNVTIKNFADDGAAYKLDIKYEFECNVTGLPSSLSQMINPISTYMGDSGDPEGLVRDIAISVTPSESGNKIHLENDNSGELGVIREALDLTLLSETEALVEMSGVITSDTPYEGSTYNAQYYMRKY